MIEESEKFKPPSGKTPGRILVAIHGAGETGVYRWEAEVFAYDDNSAVYWLNEGVGFDDFFDDVDFPGEGFWVVEDITVSWTRGDRYMDDDDMRWQYGKIRPATANEIATKTLT